MMTAANTRPGLKVGPSNEFTLISALKPGGAERTRKLMPSGFTGQRQKNTDRLGTIHDLRFVNFNNYTRVIFASTFDGDSDPYITYFATNIPDEIDLLFNELEEYPGIHCPNIKDSIAKQQVTATSFCSAYPNASVKCYKSEITVGQENAS